MTGSRVDHPASGTRSGLSAFLRRSCQWVCLLVAGSIAAAAIAAPDTSADKTAEIRWTPSFVRDGITVATRAVSGRAYREFRAEMTVRTSLASLLGVLDDADSCARWLHQCELARVIERPSATRRLVYQVSDLPFPARSRDLVLDITISKQGDGIRVDMRSAPDRHPRTRRVRIIDSFGYYLLHPVDDGVHIVWTQYVDPAGVLPAFMVNALLTDIPFHSFRKLRDWVREDRYQRLELLRDGAGNPVGLR